MVRVPAGSFEMGSNEDWTWSPCYTCEQPVHTVNIAYDFYMGKYELTQQQWLALMGSWPGSSPLSNYGLGDNYPAYFISWNDAQNFITALNAYVTSTSQGPATFRLPSEAEWEYACRARTQTRFFFGDSTLGPTVCSPGPAGDLGDYAWFCGNNSPYGSKPVGTKRPNAFGLYDMHGNLWEWCQDWYHGSYAGAPTDGSAWETPVGTSRVGRGGLWDAYPENCRSAYRGYTASIARRPDCGFRLARTP
jgi:formylglycine-generating enzyme required for sulfatase activity